MGVALSGDRPELGPADFPLPAAERPRTEAAMSPVVDVPDCGLDYEETLAVIELAWAAVGDPIAGEGYEIGGELLSPAEGLNEVFIVHSRTNMQIADLRESETLKFRWETGDG